MKPCDPAMKQSIHLIRLTRDLPLNRLFIVTYPKSYCVGLGEQIEGIWKYYGLS